jgi:magnesium-transporting ATPase (P-type)
MYEHKKQPLAPKHIFYRRIWKNILLASVFLFICLLIGVIGYKYTVPGFDWYDSLLNASMILSGMGPVIDSDIQLTNTAKVFASFYALFSGVAFITNIGIVLAPVAHRFLHRLNFEDEG